MFSLHTKLSIARATLTKRVPYYVQFYINGRCNLMCRQCNIVETNSRVEEMDLPTIARAADNMKRVGVGIVLLTGGEPFMRPDLAEIVRIFKDRHMDVRLQTAGTRYATRERLLACYEAGARDINVSLDSLDFAKSDYINAVPGSGKNAIETIEIISEVFRASSAILSFGTVLSRFNHREIPAIVEFAQRIGWYVSLVPVHITAPGRPKGFRSYDDDFVFRPADQVALRSCIETVVRQKRAGLPVFDSERFLWSAYAFLQGKGPTWRHRGLCDSPHLYFAIRPNGDFSTCCDYTLVDPPRVFEDGFAEAFNTGRIAHRPDVRGIVENCSGCHYGSYPEVTLSVRDPKAFVERVRTVLSSSRGRLRQAAVTTDFVGEIASLQQRHPEVYPVSQWMDEAMLGKIEGWASTASRKDMIRADRARRGEQGRIRGEGPDIPIGPEDPLTAS